MLSGIDEIVLYLKKLFISHLHPSYHSSKNFLTSSGFLIIPQTTSMTRYMHNRQKNEIRFIFSQTPIKTATIDNFNFPKNTPSSVLIFIILTLTIQPAA